MAKMGNEELTVTDKGAAVAELTMEQVAAIGTEVEATPEVPKVTPEPLKVATTEGESPTPVDTQSDPAQDAVQKRINKITADKYAEKRRADALQAKLDAQAPAKPELPAEAPQLEDFDYDEAKHQEALIQHQVSKALVSKQAEIDRQNIAQVKNQVADEFTLKEVEYASVHPEYAEEVGHLPAFQEDTLNAIYELGPKVSHYLAKHLDVANEIAAASHTTAAVKLGQISMGLSAENKTIKPSTAPTPVETLTGGGEVNKDMGDMSMDEIYNLPT